MNVTLARLSGFSRRQDFSIIKKNKTMRDFVNNTERREEGDGGREGVRTKER